MSAPDDVAVAELSTPVGRLSVAVTRAGVAAVGWRSGQALLQRVGLPELRDPGRTAAAVEQLGAYFRGELRDFDLAPDWRLTSGSARSVLQALHDRVGFGASVTYGELAELSGTGVPARGIGGIMGGNPLPILVPCHRVLAHDGLGGYSGGTNGNGLDVKRWLLTLEGVLTPTFDWDPERL